MISVYRHLILHIHMVLMLLYYKVTTYRYGTNAFMVCENEMLLKNKFHVNASDNSQNQSEYIC